MSAGVQISTPLVLGLTLESGNALMTSGAFACPLTMKDAILTGSSSGADVGMTWPLALGSMLPTNGATSYGVTSGAFTVPITMQGATLRSSVDSADLGISWPFALGSVLGTSGFSMVSGWFECPIAIASAEPSQSETADSRNIGAGKSRRKPDIVVTVDGEDFHVTSESEAISLLESVRETATEAADAVMAKAASARNRPKRKLLADARKSLALPTIEVPESLQTAAQGVLSDIEDAYNAAIRTIEIGAYLRIQADQDEEDAILLLMMV